MRSLAFLHIAVVRNLFALLGLLLVVAVIAFALYDEPATAVPSAFPGFDAVYEVPVPSGVRVERFEYRGANDWRLTTLRDDSNPETVGSYKAAEAGKHVSYNAKFGDQQESAITSGAQAVPGPWLQAPAAQVGVSEDRVSGTERIIRVARTAQCPNAVATPTGSDDGSETSAEAVDDTSQANPNCGAGQRAVTWTEEYTYDAASGIPLRITITAADGQETELRRAVSFSLR